MVVSVVIPVYNGEKYIAATIESVLNQTFSNIELIVVDDGSADGTSRILDTFLSAGKNIKIIRLDRSGVSHARNEGLKIASGKYISFLDADDVWSNHNLLHKVNFLSQNQNAFGVTSFYEEINETGKGSGIVKRGDYKVELRDLLSWRGNYITIPSGILFRTEIIRHSGGFNEQLSNNADQELIMRLLYQGFYFFTLQEKTWFYRRHGSNMSARLDLMETDTLSCYRLAEQNRYFGGQFFKNRCLSRMAMILALSWLKNGRNFPRALKWFGFSFLYSPAQFTGELIERAMALPRSFFSSEKK